MLSPAFVVGSCLQLERRKKKVSRNPGFCYLERYLVLKEGLELFHSGRKRLSDLRVGENVPFRRFSIVCCWCCTEILNSHLNLFQLICIYLVSILWGLYCSLMITMWYRNSHKKLFQIFGSGIQYMNHTLLFIMFNCKLNLLQLICRCLVSIMWGLYCSLMITVWYRNSHKNLFQTFDIVDLGYNETIYRLY